jgi:Pectate lyase superfamily protein
MKNQKNASVGVGDSRVALPAVTARRSFLKGVGASGLGAAAVLAACGGSGGSSEKTSDGAGSAAKLPVTACLLAGYDKVFNVKDYGAVGVSGHADEDTQGFVDAIAAATGKPGSVVYVPDGVYTINRVLVLDGVTLLGKVVPGWPSDHFTVMPKILPVATPATSNDAFLTLKNGASLSGIFLECNEPANQANWIIQIEEGAAKVQIDGIRISDCQNAIKTAGLANAGGVSIANCFLHNVVKRAVYLQASTALTGDKVEMRNVHVWKNSGAWSFTAHGFYIENPMDVSLDACSVFTCDRGIEIAGSRTGTGLGRVKVRNFDADLNGTTLVLSSPCDLEVIGGVFWQHESALWTTGNTEAARVSVLGADMKSNGSPVINVGALASLTVKGSHLNRSFAYRQNLVAVSAPSVGELNLSGCILESVRSSAGQNPAQWLLNLSGAQAVTDALARNAVVAAKAA